MKVNGKRLERALEDFGELGVDPLVPVAHEGKVAEALEELEMTVPGMLGDLLAEGRGAWTSWLKPKTCIGTRQSGNWS